MRIPKLVLLSYSCHAARVHGLVRVTHCGKVVGPAESPHAGCPAQVSVAGGVARFTCRRHGGVRNVEVDDLTVSFLLAQEARDAA